MADTLHRTVFHTFLASLVLVLVACSTLHAQNDESKSAQPAKPAATLTQPEDWPGGVLIVVKDKSGLVSNDQPLYIGSNTVGWNPGDPSMKLSGRSDLRWQILLPHDHFTKTGKMAFKFTRGSWETVEVASDLADIFNRKLEPVDTTGLDPSKPIVVELEIEHFTDERKGADKPNFATDPTAPLKVTGTAHRLQVRGGSGKAISAVRDLIVWTPPAYDDPANADRHYPVLYLQDGQNVFDFAPPTPAEWQADETATKLINAGRMQPIIIVAIPNSGANRSVEYMPDHAGDSIDIDGQGDAYIDWMIREVIPRVDRAFRTSTHAADRAIGGSSLGALIALRAAALHGETFGKVLALSPALILGQTDITRNLMDISKPWPARTYIAIGTAEYGPGEKQQAQSARLVETTESLARHLQTAATDKSNIMFHIAPNAHHDETAWQQQLPEALQFLFSSNNQH